MMGVIANLSWADKSRRQLVEAALAPDILIGMPHLTPFGLSETWLLKELAHRHWLMLGQSMGLDDADFRMPDGGEVYAAICASAVRQAAFADIAANDIFTVRSTLAPVSSTRMASFHQLTVDDRAVGEVELISAFVHRADGGKNGTIARVQLPRFEPSGVQRSSELARRLQSMRSGDPSEAGLAPDGSAVTHRYKFTPSQLQDFNGAKLLYFANFQSIIDRAMEAWFGAPLYVLDRWTFFTGNIGAGEDLFVNLLEGSTEGKRQITLERTNRQVIARQVATYVPIQESPLFASRTP